MFSFSSIIFLFYDPLYTTSSILFICAFSDKWERIIIFYVSKNKCLISTDFY